jgi:hypothetical protein
LEEPVKSLDRAELVWAEQVKEFFDIIQKAVDVASGKLKVVNIPMNEITTYLTGHQIRVLAERPPTCVNLFAALDYPWWWCHD